MRFVKFRFENLKGIREASLSLSPEFSDGRVATLVGLNESGKTTILEGIDRFYAGGESEEIRPKDLLDIEEADPYELIPIAERANFNGTVEIEATVRLDDQDMKEIRAGLRRVTGFVATELHDEIEISNKYIFKDSKLQKSGTYWPTDLGKGRTKTGQVTRTISPSLAGGHWTALIAQLRSRVPMIWYFPNFLFDFPDEVVLQEVPGESPSNRLFRSLFQDILRSIDPGMNVQSHIVDRVLSGDRTDRQSLNQLKMAIGAEVTSTVVSQWNLLFDNDAMQGKRIFLEIETSEGPSGPIVCARFLLEDGSELFSIRERSLGFRWFFVYLLLTTYRGRRSGPRNVLFLLDEPASNLHSSAQGVLLGSVAKLSEKSQVIYTTHSHHLVNPLWLQSTFVVANEGSDPSRITSAITAKNTDISVTRYPEFANRHPSKQHYFQPVLDVLAYRPTQLELVPEVVMTEGKSDYYLLTYYLSVLRDKVEPNLNLLPGTGSGSLDLVIQLYLGWGRNFVVLLDSDQGGQDARNHYEKKFGSGISDRILNLRDVSGSADVRTIETLLQEKDQLAFQKLVDPASVKWHKRNWSLGLEQAVATRASLDFSPDAHARLDAVISALSSELAKRRS